MTLRDGIADACIAIAVFHHLATDKRRLQAIEDISRKYSFSIDQVLDYSQILHYCRDRV